MRPRVPRGARAAALAVAAAGLALAAAGCARQEPAPGPPPPATVQEQDPRTLAILRRDFEGHKESWNAVMVGPDSPLSADRAESFRELEFYPFAPQWRFSGDLERLDPPVILEVPDTKGGRQLYMDYGRYRFLVGADTLTLAVHRPADHPEQYFIAFTDSTNGQGTYAGGRYVHLDSVGVHEFVLDFNRAYNPYCAYDSLWICTLPPRQNLLPVPVFAGMKDLP